MTRVLNLTMTFKEGNPAYSWGNDHIAYEIHYFYETGILQIQRVEAFGDRTLIGKFQDKEGREMLDALLEIAEMDYERFKKEVLEKCSY